MINNLPEYTSLLAIKSFGYLGDAEALEHLGVLIDLASERGERPGLEHAVVLAEELERRQMGDVDHTLLRYFVGNAWAAIQQQDVADGAKFGGWEDEAREKSVLYYRRALQHEGFAALPSERRCQILTNLANQLSGIGRFVEAIDYWDQALALEPTFAMARGNRGYGRLHYARYLYDHAHVALFLEYAEPDLVAALGAPLFPEARQTFARALEWAREKLAALPVDSLADDDLTDMSDDERYYRGWCLDNRLFLNPLNDLGLLPVAARDSLIPPSVVTGLDEGPNHIGLFNQMKQEYVSTRYLLFEGLRNNGPHFSDRGVRLYNTLDYPAYSFHVEKVRLAFRSAYSLLDKAAFFLNWYLGWNIPEKSINFKTCWYSAQDKKKGIRSAILARENWPLRGLFWLSKDLFEDRPGFRDFMEPEARELYTIRNHLEHKYPKLHDMWVGQASATDPFADKLAHSLPRADFERKTLHLFKTVRAALIYLCFSMRHEEYERERVRPPGGIVPLIWLDVIEDDWKV